MLHVCDDISDAMRRSGMTGFPLMVVVHAAQTPSDATHSESQGTARAALPGLYHEANGELVGSYALSQFHSGAAQRRAVESILQSTRLGAVVFVHFIEHATTEYNNFAQIIPPSSQTFTHTGSGEAAFPQVHIFPSSRIALGPQHLSGAQVTPTRLCSAISTACELPVDGVRTHMMMPNGEMIKLGANGAQSPAAQAVTALKGELDAEVERIQAMQRRRPAAMSRGASAPATAAAPPSSSSSSSQTPASAAQIPSPASSSSQMHLIRVLQLPGGRKKTIVTHPTMRLSRVWHDVASQLQRVQQEAGASSSSACGDGRPLCDAQHPPPLFSLRLVHCSEADMPHTAESETTTMSSNATCRVQFVRSVAEAEQVVLCSLPSGTCVYVQLQQEPCVTKRAVVENVEEKQECTADGDAEMTAGQRREGGASSAECNATRSLRPVIAADARAGSTPSSPSPSLVVPVQPPAVPGHDGSNSDAHIVGTCTDQPRDKNDTRKDNPHNNEGASVDETTSMSKPTATNSEPALILIRCTLPDGRAENMENLSPTRATIQQDIRPRVTELLGHGHFVFVRSYPPQRYRPQVEEMQTLQSLGLTTRSVLRVVATTPTSASSHSSRSSSSSNAAHTDPAATAGSSTPSALASAGAMSVQMFGSMLRRLVTGGASGTGTPAEPNRVNGGGGRGVGVGGARGTRSAASRSTGLRCMSDLLASQEAEEEDEARGQTQQQQMQQLLQQFRMQQHMSPLPQSQSHISQSHADGTTGGLTLSSGSTRAAAAAGGGGNRKDGTSAEDAGSSATKKSNRYFGGDSTEFIAREGAEELDDDDSSRGSQTEGSAVPTQAQPFAGAGRRLSGRNRSEERQQEARHARDAKSPRDGQE